jgi:hypothetical protein
MKTLSSFLGLTLLALTLNAGSAEVPKARLANLVTDYVPIAPVEERPGALTLLEARFLPGDGFILRLPFHANRFTPLVAQGAVVAAGQVVARVEGPELEAWLIHADGIEARFRAAEKRYRDGLALYEKQSLAASKWAEIAEQYFALVARMHHVEHTREILRPLDHNRAEVSAPRAGRISFLERTGDDSEEVDIARIIAPDALRLTGRISQRGDAEPSRILIGACAVPVSHVEEQVRNLSRQVWSQALPPCLDPAPGALREGRFAYPFQGYAVPRAAVASVAGQAGIFIEEGAVLRFVPVAIASADPARFYLRSDSDLAGRRVLTASVSAAQGILLGLGLD